MSRFVIFAPKILGKSKQNISFAVAWPQHNITLLSACGQKRFIFLFSDE